MYCELHGISYPSGIRRVRSQGISMAFSNIDGESVEGILKFEALDIFIISPFTHTLAAC